MPHNPHADFSPTLKGYTGQEPFRFWCQLALPLTFDDSLSYYELLNKVVVYLNNTIHDVANVEENVEGLNTAYNQLQNYVNEYFDNLDLQAEINRKLDEMASDGTLTALINPLIPDTVTAWLNAHITYPDPGKAVIVDDTLTVSGAAADAKVTGDKINKLNEQVEEISEDVEWAIPTAGAYNNNSGVTCEIMDDGKLKLYGIATATRTYLFLNGQNKFAVNSTEFQKTMEAGTYDVEISVSGALTANIQIYYTYSTFANGTTAISRVNPKDIITFTDPIMLGLRFATGTNFGTTDEPTYINFSATKFTADDEKARSEINALETRVSDIERAKGIANMNAKMRSFGNSILTGSVNINGTFDHLSTYDNAPYGRIARALGIPEENVRHTLMDSTGLIHDAGQGSFLEAIKETDMSEYDYLLTQLWSSDLNDLGIGTINDTAENETIAGAVVDLINYINTSNGMCQLILISVPPVSYNYTGRSVFTHVYDGGNNVLELDELMHKMAEKYQFIYVDWQSLALSYYYQNYTDGYNVHANNEETYRVMGDYLAMNLRYAQSDVSNRLDGEETFGIDVLRENGKFQTGTNNGITFTWNENGTVCTVSGMATARANHNIYSQQRYLPKGIFPGDDMIVRFHASSGNVYPRSIFWASGEVEISNTPLTMDIPIHVPENAIGWTLRLNVESGKDLTGDKAVRVDRIQAIKLHPRRMDVPLIVSFVDDDTSADQYVTRYHDNCCHNGVAGNYAVITKHIEDGDTTLSTMLDYQDDGFGILLHCYEQVPTGDNYWTASPRTKAQTNQCRANLIKGMNYLRENGFVNYRHWITPGGHREDDLVAVAKEIGLFNLISTQNGRENTPQDCNRWFIKRVSLKHDDTSPSMTMEKVKEYIDTTVAHGCGWLIIVTHFNEGWKHLTGADAWDSTIDANGYPVGYPRFNEMVQYALSKGMVPMTVPEAWAYYEPILTANYAECTEGNA